MAGRVGRPRRGHPSTGSLPVGPVRAAGYLRVSTADQANEGFGLEAQETRIRAHCVAQGWELVGLYVDPGISGATMERPALTRLREDAEAGVFARVVVLKLDRLARSARHLLNLYDELERHGVTIAS